MSAPPLVALAECCEVVGGGTPRTSDPGSWDGEIAWATPKDVSELAERYIGATARNITSEGLRRSGARVLPPGSVLLSSRAPIGLVAINTVPMATNQGFKSLIPDTARADARYLAHWLGANTARLQGLGNGATFKEVSKSIVSKVKVPLPPLAEQRRVAQVLDAADALRAKRLEWLDRARALRGSLVECAVEPSLGEEPLADILSEAEVFTDGDWVESKDQDPQGDVRLVQLADIGDGHFIDRSARYLTSSTAERLKCTYLEPGDVLIARMPDPLGRACLFPESRQPCVTVVDVCVVRPTRGGVDPVWLMAAINSASVRRDIARRATGTTRSRISRGNLARVPIPALPTPAQQAFRNKVGWLELASSRARAHLRHLDTLFASLQSRAFSGEL